MENSWNYPAPNNPIHFILSGHVPALKNNKIWVQKGKRGYPVSNQTVRNFVSRSKGLARAKIDSFGFDVIPVDVPVAMVTEFWFYTQNESGISQSDEDNAITMVQEMLEVQRRDDDNKVVNSMGVLGVIADDRQVVEHHSRAYPVLNKIHEGANVFLYVLTDIQSSIQRDMDYASFLTWRGQQRIESEPKNIEIDFDTIDDLLT